MPRSAPAASLPDGFKYVPDVISPAIERDLVAAIETLPLHAAMYRGFAAKRRIVFFEDGVPEFLLPLRTTAAAVAGVEESALATALVTEYSPGAVIGWHRDAPAYGSVVGISLASACRMRLRRMEADANGRVPRVTVALDPRSAYVMDAEARAGWQHSIPAVDALRYSVTFRTLRRGRAAAWPRRLKKDVKAM